jgi:hypothetical protein
MYHVMNHVPYVQYTAFALQEDYADGATRCGVNSFTPKRVDRVQFRQSQLVGYG